MMAVALFVLLIALTIVVLVQMLLVFASIYLNEEYFHPKQGIAKGTEFKVNAQHQNEFKIKYKYGFYHKEFSYFVTVQVCTQWCCWVIGRYIPCVMFYFLCSMCYLYCV